MEQTFDASTNGHAVAESGDSVEYRRLKAGMDAWEMWEALEPIEKLDVIMAQYGKAQWLEPDILAVLATFREEPVGLWEQIKLRYKEIGGNPWDLERAVDKLLRTTAPASPAPDQTPRADMTTLADVQESPVEWLWPPYLAKGTIAMMDGDPGLGKSLLTLQLAACLSKGFPLPDQDGKPTVPTGGPQHVLLITSEDSPEHTIKPRLLQAGGDPTYVHILNGWTDPQAADPTEIQGFDLKHIPILEQALERFPAALVVIDPLQAVLGGIDMHRSNETRPLLAKLGALARKHNIVILCVRHPAKAGEGMGKALHRGLGSVDIVGIARTALFVEGYPNDDTRAFVAQTKSNLEKKGRTLVFSKAEGVFRWAGVTRLKDKDLAGSGRGPNHRAFLEAFLWLEHRLAGGAAWNGKVIEEEAEGEDISRDLLKRAKKALGVVSSQIKGMPHGGWSWRLPPLVSPPTPPPTPTPTDPSDPTDTTDTTNTSNLKSRGYEESGVSGSVGTDESVGSLGSVVGVVETFPCALCGKSDRWDDQGVHRCVSCMPRKEPNHVP